VPPPGGRGQGQPAGSGPPARPRALLAAALALLAVAGAFAAVVAAHPVRPPTARLDRWWLATVHGWQQPWLTRAGVVISYLAGPWGGTVLVAIVVFVLLLRRRWWWTALFVALTEAAGSGASQLIKHLVRRPRPPHPLVRADFGSFPSGHVITTVAVGLALTAALARPARRPVWLAGTALAAVIMILTRTYLRAHWLSDTFEGVAVGAGLALLLWWWFTPKLAAERRRPLDSSSTGNHDHA